MHPRELLQANYKMGLLDTAWTRCTCLTLIEHLGKSNTMVLKIYSIVANFPKHKHTKVGGSEQHNPIGKLFKESRRTFFVFFFDINL